MTRIANLTVAIATMERPEELRRCLEALLAGEVLPAEVIIIDQSQGDVTQALIEGMSSYTVSIVYYRQQRLGLSASRNLALSLARCQSIAVTDDDCVPDCGWVAAIERTFSLPSKPAAVTGRVLPLGPEVPGLYDISSRNSTQGLEFKGKTIPWLVGTGANFAITRAWLNRIGSFDECLGTGSPGQAAEDADFIYRLLCAGGEIRYEPAALILHERQRKIRRMATRFSYGFGIGVFCAKWFRKGDTYALYMLGYWLLYQLKKSVSAALRQDWTQIHQRALSLWGTIRGCGYGLFLRSASLS